MKMYIVVDAIERGERKMIKMKYDKNQEAICDNCGNSHIEALEMYDIKIGDKVICLCDECNQALFYKCLKASCTLDAKVKSKEEILKINRRNIKRKKKKE